MAEKRRSAEEELFLILDSENQPLAHGKLLGRPAGGALKLTLIDSRCPELSGHEILRLVGMGRGRPVVLCRFVRQLQRQLTLERLVLLAPELREELRVPVHFESFLYPLNKEWRGRRPISGVDLSFRGVAFYGEDGLGRGEKLEMVLPVGKAPLLLRCEILRVKPMSRGRALYAAKFVDLCADEETLISEAVFGIEVHEGASLRKNGIEIMESEE